MEYKILLGALATLIAFIAYVPYIRDIFRGKTKPHAFSWLVWSLLTLIGFAAQVTTGGGAGAWVTGFSGIMCFGIFVLALNKGNRDFPVVDWIALLASLIALLLWYFTKQPLWSVILICAVNAIAFVPTFRKGYVKPNEETLSEFVLSSVKYAVSFFALSSYSITTWLYPISLVFTNALFSAMIWWRRKTAET